MPFLFVELKVSTPHVEFGHPSALTPIPLLLLLLLLLLLPPPPPPPQLTSLLACTLNLAHFCQAAIVRKLLARLL